MQDMIKRIIDADNEARALEEKNRRDAEAQKAKIERKSQEMYRRKMAEAMDTVKKNDEYEEQQTEKKWAEISARQASAMIKLRSDYDNNRDRWVDEIVTRVIEGA